MTKGLLRNSGTDPPSQEAIGPLGTNCFLMEVRNTSLMTEKNVGQSQGGGGGGGGTLIFHTYVGSGHFWWVQNFEFQYFWAFQKNKYVLGYEDFVDIFLRLLQNWTIFRGHFYAFYGLFLRSRYKIADIVLGLLKFQIFFGMLEMRNELVLKKYLVWAL